MHFAVLAAADAYCKTGKLFKQEADRFGSRGVLFHPFLERLDDHKD